MTTKRQIAASIVSRLREAGHEAYFVGGCVRDMLLKKEPSDFDIATDAHPDKIEKLFKRTIPVGKAFGVIIVLENNLEFEVATFRQDLEYKDGRRPEGVRFSTAKEDSLRRDFTVNGLFFDPEEKKVMDWVGGQKDLKAKVIRTIGDPIQRFKEDKLRLLRAIRFATNLNFKIEKATFAAVCKMHKDIASVSAERVRDELVKLLTGPYPARGFELLDESGMLKVILPEIEALKGVEQPVEHHPEGDVFVHTMLLMKKLKSSNLILALGCLLHDIGKPKTFRRAADRIRFNGHDKVGARMAEEVLKRLRFSNDITRQVTSCVEWHMQFKDAKQMRPATLKKMFQRETFTIELEQHKYDCQASHNDLSIWRFLTKKLKSLSKEEIRPEPFLRGKDLIDAGVKPGPAMGKLLKLLEEKQLDGELKSREEALRWLQKYLKDHKI